MFKEEAIVLIRYSETTHRYEVTQEAAALIASINTPLAVISVAGMYRTGKSYLLNRMLLNRSNGFGVGPTINPCTKGLWMWGQPIRSQSQNGQPLTLLIIDTQGLGALDQDQTHDCKIFSLAILLSTCFVYNSVGSIDENAIQSLNMVLNLTDHISKVSRGDSTSQTEMPNFVWVVRDFSLQLIDDKGNNITAKEYLENALAQQKGTSKETEEKNKIRKFIAESFGTRQCFTLVKPLIHEQKLQALDKVPFEELRPEFIEQVIALRKRVMGKLKAKTIKNVALTGEAYLTTVKCYVEAINNGAVPNIQSAWDYMCMEQNTRKVDESRHNFETYLKETVQPRIPCTEVELRQLIAVGKEQVTGFLKTKLLGDGIQQFLDDLRAFMDSKTQSVVVANQKESASAALNFITKEYQQINKKLKSSYYGKFVDFESELRSLCAFMLDKNRRFAGCEVVYLDFTNKRLSEGSQFFARLLEQEIELLKTTKADTLGKYERDLSDLKTESLRQKAHLTELINRLEREKVEMSINSEQTNKHLKDLTEQNSQMEMHYRAKFDHLTKQLEAVSRELRSKEQLLQEKQLESERNGFLRDGEWQKQRALHQQEKKFLKDKLEVAERKQKQLEQGLSQTKADLEARLRDYQAKEESRSKQLAAQLAEKTEKLGELTDAHKFLQEEMKSLEEFSERKEKKLKEDLQALERALDGFKNNGAMEKNRLMVESINEKKQLLLGLDQQREKVRTLEIQLKQQTDQVKLCRATIEKDKAIYTQKIEFQTLELNDLRGRFSQLQNKYHEAANSFESSSREKMDEAQRALIFDLKAAHEQQMKELVIDQEAHQRQLRSELEDIKKRREQRELQIQLDSKRAQQRERDLRDSLRKVEDMCERLQREKLSSEKGSEEVKKDLECHFAIKIRKLQKELDEVKENSKAELSEMDSKTESTIRELKHYFDIQRQRLERKIQEEKEKGEKKCKRLLEQADQRFGQERGQLEEDNGMLRQNLSELQSASNQRIANLQYQFNVTVQKLNNEILEKKIEFNKQAAVMQQQLDHSTKRVDELTREKDRQAIRFEEKIRLAKEEAQAEVRQAVARLSEEKAIMEQKNDKLKKSLKETQNSLHKIAVDYERDKTMLTEKASSLELRLSEYQQRSRHEKKLLEEQLQKLNENHKIERAGLLREIEKYKDQNLKIEQQKQETITRYENEKVLTINKLNFLEDQKRRSKSDYEDMLLKFETTVKHLTKEREALQNERNQMANEVALTLKSQYQREADGLRSNHNKIVRDLEDKVNRLLSEKKALSDKSLAMEVKLSTLSSQTQTNETEKRLTRDLDRIRQQYEAKMDEYQKMLDQERRDHKKNVEKLEARIHELERRNRDNPYPFQNDRDRWNGADRSAIKDTTNLGSTGKQASRESESKKSRLTTLTPTTGGLGSTTSLLNNIGQTAPKRSTNDYQYRDTSDYNGIIRIGERPKY